jgi:hypothetical protein
MEIDCVDEHVALRGWNSWGRHLRGDSATRAERHGYRAITSISRSMPGSTLNLPL